MTAAERQQRHRDRIKAATPKYALTDEQRLRQDIRRVVDFFMELRPDLTLCDIAKILKDEAFGYQLRAIRAGDLRTSLADDWPGSIFEQWWRDCIAGAQRSPASVTDGAGNAG